MDLFTSERLSFGLWTASSAHDLAVINQMPEVMRYFPRTYLAAETLAFAERQNKQYQTRGYCYYAVSLLADQERCIGFIGMSYQRYDSPYTPAVDIGWRLHPDYWGRGLATEGAAYVLKHGHTVLAIDQIISVCPQDNISSQRVMIKAGMEQVGTFDHPALAAYPDLASCYCYRSSSDKVR